MNQTKELLLSISKSASKIVQKVWGVEYHVVNNEKFCLKYLVFYKGGKISFHAHKIKTELFHCLTGQFGLKTQNRREMHGLIFEGDIKLCIFNEGDKILLNTETYHQLEAFEDSIIVEVSTTDREEDSYRIDQSSYDKNNDKNKDLYK